MDPTSSSRGLFEALELGLDDDPPPKRAKLSTEMRQVVHSENNSSKTVEPESEKLLNTSKTTTIPLIPSKKIANLMKNWNGGVTHWKIEPNLDPPVPEIQFPIESPLKNGAAPNEDNECRESSVSAEQVQSETSESSPSEVNSNHNQTKVLNGNNLWHEKGETFDQTAELGNTGMENDKSTPDELAEHPTEAGRTEASESQICDRVSTESSLQTTDDVLFKDKESEESTVSNSTQVDTDTKYIEEEKKGLDCSKESFAEESTSCGSVSTQQQNAETITNKPAVHNSSQSSIPGVSRVEMTESARTQLIKGIFPLRSNQGYFVVNPIAAAQSQVSTFTNVASSSAKETVRRIENIDKTVQLVAKNFTDTKTYDIYYKTLSENLESVSILPPLTDEEITMFCEDDDPPRGSSLTSGMSAQSLREFSEPGVDFSAENPFAVWAPDDLVSKADSSSSLPGLVAKNISIPINEGPRNVNQDASCSSSVSVRNEQRLTLSFGGESLITLPALSAAPIPSFSISEQQPKSTDFSQYPTCSANRNRDTTCSDSMNNNSIQIKKESIFDSTESQTTKTSQLDCSQTPERHPTPNLQPPEQECSSSTSSNVVDNPDCRPDKSRESSLSNNCRELIKFTMRQYRNTWLIDAHNSSLAVQKALDDYTKLKFKNAEIVSTLLSSEHKLQKIFPAQNATATSTSVGDAQSANVLNSSNAPSPAPIIPPPFDHEENPLPHSPSSSMFATQNQSLNAITSQVASPNASQLVIAQPSSLLDQRLVLQTPSLVSYSSNTLSQPDRHRCSEPKKKPRGRPPKIDSSPLSYERPQPAIRPMPMLGVKPRNPSSQVSNASAPNSNELSGSRLYQLVPMPQNTSEPTTVLPQFTAANNPNQQMRLVQYLEQPRIAHSVASQIPSQQTVPKPGVYLQSNGQPDSRNQQVYSILDSSASAVNRSGSQIEVPGNSTVVDLVSDDEEESSVSTNSGVTNGRQSNVSNNHLKQSRSSSSLTSDSRSKTNERVKRSSGPSAPITQDHEKVSTIESSAYYQLPPRLGLVASISSNGSNKGATLTWQLADQNARMTDVKIDKYELLALTNHPSAKHTRPGWMLVETIKALDLPMQCMLTNLNSGLISFVIRGVDCFQRKGEFSNVVSILIP